MVKKVGGREREREREREKRSAMIIVWKRERSKCKALTFGEFSVVAIVDDCRGVVLQSTIFIKWSSARRTKMVSPSEEVATLEGAFRLGSIIFVVTGVPRTHQKSQKVAAKKTLIEIIENTKIGSRAG